MDELDQIIISATSSIDKNYFQLRIAGNKKIYRERVYCYELYHQMRKRWPHKSQYIINGEIDKAAHRILREMGVDNTKPDFLIHSPGDMVHNYAIIEVKHIGASVRGMKKDITTLNTFRSHVGYQRAIYLFYGTQEASKTILKVQGELDKFELPLAPIELWIHNELHSEAEKVYDFGG